MTSERILNALATFLRTKTVAAGGVLALSETVANTLAMLGTGMPGSFRVILQWQREAGTGNRGEREMTFLVIVQQGGQNLSINPGDVVSVTRPAGADDNNAALLQRCTQVCAWVRAIKFSNADVQQHMPVCVPGTASWVHDPSFPTRQIAHEFAVRFANEPTTQETITA